MGFASRRSWAANTHRFVAGLQTPIGLSNSHRFVAGLQTPIGLSNSHRFVAWLQTPIGFCERASNIRNP